MNLTLLLLFISQMIATACNEYILRLEYIVIIGQFNQFTNSALNEILSKCLLHALTT